LRGARQHRVEAELASVGRYMGLITRGISNISDVYFQLTASLEILANSNAREGYRTLYLIAGRPADSLAIALVLLAQCRSEVSEPHELEILDALADFTVCKEFARRENVEVLETLRRVPYIQQGETWANWCALRPALNERDIACIVMALLTRGSLARMGYWLGEVALEVAARFIPPISLGLSVLNLGRTFGDVLDVWYRRYAMHSEYANLIAGNPSNFNAASIGSGLLPSMIFMDSEIRTEIIADEQRSRTQTILASAGLGLGGLVGGPIVIGASLATAGIIGGLGLAATPFLAAAEAYNLARGNELLMTRSRRALREIVAPPPVPVPPPVEQPRTEERVPAPQVDNSRRFTEDIDEEEADWLASSLITSNVLPGAQGRWHPSMLEDD